MEHFPAMANDPLYDLSPAPLVERAFTLNNYAECSLLFNWRIVAVAPLTPGTRIAARIKA
jgi:hypothetical protein